MSDDDLAYFERWAAAMEERSGTYTADLQEDMKDRARRMRALVAEVRAARTKVAT